MVKFTAAMPDASFGAFFDAGNATEAKIREGVALTGGTAAGGEGGATSEITLQYDAIFDNAEERDVSFLISGPADTALKNNLVSIAEKRKDCIVTLSPDSDAVVEQSSGQATAILADAAAVTTKSSFAVMDSGWKLVYDPYNDVYRYVPLNGDIAGLMVASDQDSEPWFSPAGFNRGRLRNVIKACIQSQQGLTAMLSMSRE